MSCKLLALDIDGTIVREHTDLPTKPVIQAVQKANQKIYVTLVSGRAWKDHKKIIDALSLHGNYHAIENGSQVINPKGEIEYSHYLSYTGVKGIVERIKSFLLDVAFCVDGNWIPLSSMNSASKIATISCITENKVIGNKIAHLVNNRSTKYHISVGAHWSNSQWAVVLINNTNASKGYGLSFIQRKLNISPAETIAVGDGASDVSMMQYAAKKIAMGNAEPELLEIADYVGSSVAQDGLVDIIEKFVF